MLSQNMLLNKILSTKDLSVITVNNLSEDFFFNYKAEYKFILDHYNKYGAVPDKITFVNSFPQFTLQDVAEPDSYLVEQVTDDYNKSTIASNYNQIKRMIENDASCDDVVKYVMDLTNKLQRGAILKPINILEDTSRYDRYLERTADFGNYYLGTGLPDLDKIIGGIDCKNENMVIAARTGIGKCLAKGTKVLMADGTAKAIEDVVVGDIVQSYNCTNTVQALHNGTSNGYKIIPNKGDPFIVSSNHILTLYKYNEVYDKEKGFMTTNGTGELVDITIEDFLALSKHKKHLYKLIRPAIEYSTKEQTIDPYILGAWLGDGISSQNQICSVDPEIVAAIYSFASKYGYEVHDLPSAHKFNKCPIYSITGVGNHGYFKQLLKDLSLLDNKHIPLNYLTGNREQRLQLLAGLLDTDGCYIYKATNKATSMFDFTNKNKVLFDGVAQLARGLGFKVCLQKPKMAVTKTGEVNAYYRMTISGDLYLIPTKLVRKQAIKTNHQNSLLDGFKIEPVDTVNYYGFMADGDHRYLLADNTLTHNTQLLVEIASAAAKQGKRVGFYEGEMTPDKLAYRFDAYLGHVSNMAINRGDLYAQREYQNYITSLQSFGYGPILVLTPNEAGGAVTVDTLRAFIEREHLDILCVDQYSLLEDTSHARTSFERVGNIAKEIKQLQVKYQIPIISVSQMNRTKNEDGSQDTTQIGLSDMIPQYATVLLMLDRDKNDKNKLTINIVKSRDGGDGQALNYHVNWDRGEFTYLPEDDNAVGDAESEEMLSRYED